MTEPVSIDPVRYVSTRDGATTPATASFEEVLLAGLAKDGGLYVPDEVPRFTRDEIAAMAGLSYAELATRIIAPFAGSHLGTVPLAPLVAETYAGFGHPA